MEEWIPMLDIFFKSPSPETEASLWLDEASNSSSSPASVASPINRSSFISLLKKPCDRLLFIQTLPDMVQSRILSLLLLEYRSFCVRDLVSLATEMLAARKELDFWVHRAAHHLLDTIPQPKFDSFDSLPHCLSDKAHSTGKLLPWLPVSLAHRHSQVLPLDSWYGKEMSQVRETMEEDHIQLLDETINAALQPHDHDMAAKIRAQIMSFESTPQVLTLCDEIRKLCLDKGRDSFRFLALVEPWKADDETASVFLSNLHSASAEEELGWPSQILCSIVLPKFLSLEKSASRVLMSATIGFCKIHQRAAEYALVFPLLLRKQGINNFICEVISRVLKECCHLGHVSAFCHKLLCGTRQERRFLILPCHRDLISDDLTWNESLFIFFHNILIHDIPLSQGSVDSLVSKVQELAERIEGDVVVKGGMGIITAYLSHDEQYSNISPLDAAGKTTILYKLKLCEIVRAGSGTINILDNELEK